jgi:SAM-dependent methyltransferase
MTAPNYESQWWGYIYDQMMEGDLQELLDQNRRFYQTSLQDVSGAVLECACGTGLILLPLLAAGHDIYGFDISTAMLATLRRKAVQQGIADIDQRISVQAFESFHYDRQFAAILIPTNTFAMLTTQDAQIQTLQNIYAHLAPGGKLLLDFRLAGLRDIAEEPPEIQGRWHTWTHPETGRPIRQRIVSRRDFNHQLVLDRCFIEYEDQKTDFPMTGRWLFKAEFQLLLRLAGFDHWESFRTPARDPLELGLAETQSYWIAYKSGQDEGVTR